MDWKRSTGWLPRGVSSRPFVARCCTYAACYPDPVLAMVILPVPQHRHPYIERLGFLFMLKLTQGSKFGDTAGAAWRVLLVLTLMPWMRKYRRNGSVGVVSSSMSRETMLLEIKQLREENHLLKVEMQLRTKRNSEKIRRESV